MYVQILGRQGCISVAMEDVSFAVEFFKLSEQVGIICYCTHAFETIAGSNITTHLKRVPVAPRFSSLYEEYSL